MSTNGSILREIVKFALWFNAFDCESVSRDYNKVAKFLANLAIIGKSGTWLEDSPNVIVTLLLKTW